VDKVVHGEGLVLRVLGVEWIGEGRMFHSDGRVYFEVVWCAYVWMPRAGELLLLKLESQTEQGMFLANEFMEDFYIPQKNMKSGEGEETRWNGARKRWVYVCRSGGGGSDGEGEEEGDDDAEEGGEFETGMRILVRVFDVQFKSGYELEEGGTRFSVCCKVDAERLGMVDWDYGDDVAATGGEGDGDGDGEGDGDDR